MLTYTKVPFLAEGGYITTRHITQPLFRRTVELLDTDLVTHCFVTMIKRDPIPLVLMTKHVRRGWQIPGGTRERGETPEDCALRELKEETGILGMAKSGIKLVGVYKVVNPNGDPTKFPVPISYMLVYAAKYDDPDFGPILAPPTECNDRAMLPFNEAAKSIAPWEWPTLQATYDSLYRPQKGIFTRGG